MNRYQSVFAVAVIVLGGCSREQPGTSVAAGAASATVEATAAAPRATEGGKVLQVQQAGAYTYAEVEWRGQRAWIAGTQIDIKPGDEVQWGPAAVMRNFEAKSLGRTFDQILFVTSWARAGSTPVATRAHGSLPQPASPGAGGSEASGRGVVRSVANAGGYSYIEVERGADTLWIAATEMPLKPGDRIEWQGGNEMRNFTAKSLGRSFDRVVFASAVSVQR